MYKNIKEHDGANHLNDLNTLACKIIPHAELLKSHQLHLYLKTIEQISTHLKC